MLDTTRLLLKNTFRQFISKIRGSPVLYLFFTVMLIGSIIMFAFLTFLLMRTEVDLTIDHLFFTVFFLFLVKSASDVHNYVIKSAELSYPLSTQRKHTRVFLEIVLGVLLTNLGIWFAFSLLYLLTAQALLIPIGFPVLYLLFTIGLILATMLGAVVAFHFFSPVQIRLLPTVVLLGFYWYADNMIMIVETAPVVLLHFMWAVTHGDLSYLYVKRSKRLQEPSRIQVRSIISSLFHRETTTLWRDRLFISFITTAVFTGLGTGYLIVNGSELLIPESLRGVAGDLLPAMFAFLGIYVIVLYTAVFPSLTLFLNEEKTLWILHHLPLRSSTIVYGKATTLTLCFITGIPFMAYLPIFGGTDNMLYLIWLFIFSFITAACISIPLGVKYVGKKSDILLLYSVAMILFVILSVVATVITTVTISFLSRILVYVGSIGVAMLCLFGALQISAGMLQNKLNPKVTQ